jgi:hypothetical protein
MCVTQLVVVCQYRKLLEATNIVFLTAGNFVISRPVPLLVFMAFNASIKRSMSLLVGAELWVSLVPMAGCCSVVVDVVFELRPVETGIVLPEFFAAMYDNPPIRFLIFCE